MNKMETVIMTTLWDRVLSRFKATSIHSKSDMDSATAVDLLQSLHFYVGTHREEFAEVEGSACAISVTPYQYDICCKAVCG